MMKKTIPFLLAAILCLGMAACGGAAGDPAVTTAPTTATQAPTIASAEEVTEATEPVQKATPLTIGGKIATDNFVMTFDSMEILSEYSYQTSAYSSMSLYVENGYKLLLVMGHFDNIGTTTISDSAFSRSVVVNGTYTVTDYDVRFSFKRDKYFEIDPYTDLDYCLYINIPEKLADQFETATFTLGFNDDLSYPETVYHADGTKTVTTDNLYALTSGLTAGGEVQPESAETTQPEADTPAAQALAVGDTVSTAYWEITLAKAELATAIYPVESSSSGIHYEVADGYHFVNLEFDIKNLDTDVRAFSDAVNSVVVHCGKYDYNGYSMYYYMGGSLSVTLLKGTTHGPSPLDPTHLYVETEVPDEAIDAGSVTVDLVIAGGQYTIEIS